MQNEGNPEKYSEEEIAIMKPAVFDEILDHVKRMSHMEDEELEDDVEDFPEDE